jgi:hypothetical protein
VVESAAVHTTEIDVLLPAVKACALDAAPEVTAAPATVTVVPLSVTVGVSVIEVIEFTTATVYDVTADAKLGEIVPPLKTSVLSVATARSAAVRVTATV